MSDSGKRALKNYKIIYTIIFPDWSSSVVVFYYDFSASSQSAPTTTMMKFAQSYEVRSTVDEMGVFKVENFIQGATT